MENQIPKTEEKEETKVNEGFEIHSNESDMQRLGVEVEEQESIEEEPTAEVEPKKEEATKEEPKKKSRAQRKIERQNRELKIANDKIAELESKPEAKEVAPVINPDDFENYDDYLEALETKEENPEPKKAEEKKEEPKPDSRIDDMFEDGGDDYENFEELVRADDLKISEPLLNEILEAENPSDIAYYLATHKDLSEKMSSMTPRQITKEVAKIELKLEAKPLKTVKVSNAPEPITPLEGSSTKQKSLNDDDLSFEEHEALLNKKAVGNAGGFL